MDTYEHMPLIAGVPLASATLQVIAEDAGVDLLHIKGAAVDPTLLQQAEIIDPDSGLAAIRPVPRSSVDADVLVRPSHVERLFAAMRGHRWTMVYRFEDGSAFEHASTWIRPGVCHADIHRSFPGIGLSPEAAFDVLWNERQPMTIAGQTCQVPGIPAQRLILILHAIRGGELGSPDIRRAWWEATPDERDAVQAVTSRLRADVALAAATGRLEEHRAAREYMLWKALSSGDTSRTTLWLARVKAQANPFKAIRTAFHLIAPKEGRLERDLGHRPGPVEVAKAWGQQLSLVASEAMRLARTVSQRAAGRRWHP